MTQLFRNASSIALILSVALPAAARKGQPEVPETPLVIKVRVYNYADVTRGVLAKARSEAGRIFQRSRIEISWIACAVPGREVENNPFCKSKPQATDIFVRLLPEKMAKKLMKHHSEFGIAATAPGDGFGSNLSIFYHRVDELAERTHASRKLLLGHLIAHEIGHLLLGSNSHSRSGIMHVPWNHAQMERASLGTLLFTKKEAGKMRGQVFRRVVAAENLTGVPGKTS